MQVSKNVVDKIRKLLALANSSNEHEAGVASKMAHDLVLKHNISMASVKAATAEFVVDSERAKKRQPVEQKFVSQILRDHFFVRTIINKGTWELLFIGRPENVEVAKYVRDFLIRAFKDLYTIEAKKQGWTYGRNRNAFYLGVYKGLDEKLRAQKEARITKETGAALIVTDKALTAFIHSELGKVRDHNPRIAGDREAVETGREHGRNLNIARGLGGDAEGAGLALAGGE